jgi:Zn-dependent protease with chaperone function
VTPLWARVDANRTKIAVFVVLFVVGSAALLDAALIAVPGSLLSLAFADSPDTWFRGLAIVCAVAFAVLIAVGGLLAAVQLSNAEDWVRNRFAGRDLGQGEAPDLVSAASDMALAAGLATPPRIIVIEAPGDSVNAMALGTVRERALIGVTPGFVTQLDPGEQRAVIATLTARIIAGDIMFGTALAALMGPLKAIREANRSAGGAAGAIADAGCSDPGCGSGCADGCGSGCGDIGDLGDADGCGGAIGLVLFLVFVAVVTYVAVVSAAWIVTLWGRALQRTSYEKADAEGMLLLKHPAPMLSALDQAVATSNQVTGGDVSYDGIFYAATSGTARIERVETRRLTRLREVLGTEGLAAPLPVTDESGAEADTDGTVPSVQPPQNR